MSSPTRPAADEVWWLDRAFTYVGRMDPSKGVHVVLRAYAALADTLAAAPPLWLVGGVPEEIERVRAASLDVVEPLERRKLVSWWGYQRPAAISGILSRSVALLMHSKYEPGGRVVLEALAAGVPVIATPNGFARELVRDWVSGFIVPYGDDALLRTRMLHFVRQPLLRNALGAAGRALAQDALRSWRFVETHCAVYDDAVVADVRAPSPPAPLPPDTDAFMTRAFPPTYPFSVAQASAAAVAAFATRIGAHVRLSAADRTHGPLWHATDGDTAWIIKQVGARFTVRPLWDARAPEPIVRTAGERFAAEVFAASLPAFAPFDATDSEQHLVARRAGIPATLTREAVAAFVAPLQRLQGHTVVDVAVEAFSITSDAVPAQLDATLASVRERAPFLRLGLVSPALAWPLRLADLRTGALQADPQWTETDVAAAKRYADVAGNLAPQLVLAHGNPRPEHFLRYGDELRLIAGGDMECAVMGKDLACLLLLAVGRFGAAAGQEVLARCAADEARAVIAWASLLAFEGICRNVTLRRGARLRWYRTLWDAVFDLTEAVIP